VVGEAAGELELGALELRVAPLAASAVLFAAAQLLAALLWAALVRAVAPDSEPHRQVSLWFLSQFGKYVPGNVAGLAIRALHSGARFESVATAFVAEAALHAAASALLGLAVFSQILGMPRWAAVVPATLVLAVLLTRRRILALVDGVLKRLRRAPLGDLSFGRASSALVAALLCAYWCVAASSFWLLCLGLGSDIAWSRAAPLFALAWCAGFLALPVPAGIGVREAVLVAGLSPVLGSGAALLLAGASRAWSTLLDVATSLVGSVVALGWARSLAWVRGPAASPPQD
jgi:uncharacterized membrane protein YbhN (UPF0104 family)